MSTRGATACLWIAMCATVPAPFFAVETGRIPVVGLAVLATATARAALADAELTANFLTAFLAVQIAFYGSVFYGLARLAARALARRIPGRLAVVVGALVVVAIVGAMSFDLYVMPFARREIRTNLWGVFN
jgi:hypothetical protein